jgi:hypothetical protein
MSTNPKITTMIDALRAELLEAESILNTQYSFDLAEPNYVKCLQLIAEVPEQREQVANLITSLFTSGEVSDEPVAFLMHALRWPDVFDWAKNRLRGLENPIADGRPLEKIVAAFSDDWENKNFYKMFSIEPPAA